MRQGSRIVCSRCGEDITYASNSMEWRIVLKSEEIPTPPGGGAVTDMHMEDPVPYPLYFCSIKCLARMEIDEATMAAASDPDGPPLNDKELARFKRRTR